MCEDNNNNASVNGNAQGSVIISGNGNSIMVSVGGVAPTVRNIDSPVTEMGRTEREYMREIKFVNRVEELGKIIHPHWTPCLLISAPMGYGKTKLINEAKEQLINQNWFCIHMRLYREKDYSIREISLEILNQIEQREFSSIELDTTERCAHQISRYILNKNKEKILILIDQVECINIELSREFLNTFIPLVKRGLLIARNPIELRLIFAGRYINWDQENFEYPLSRLVLTPFDFDAIHQTIENFDSRSSNRRNSDYKREFAFHLMYFTGGHPGCMARSLCENYGELNLNEERLYQNIILPIIAEINNNIPNNLRDIFSKLSVVRRFNPSLLRYFIDNRVFQWSQTESKLEDLLLQTSLVVSRGGFLEDGIVRRLLSFNLRKNNFELFIEVCEKAISFYALRLKDAKSYRGDIIAIELLYQKMQYLYYKPHRRRRIAKGNFFNSPYAVIFKSCNFCNSEKAERNALI